MYSDDLNTMYAKATGRRLYFHPTLNAYGSSDIKQLVTAKSQLEPNLISSEQESGLHMPVIDCDYAIQAVPSSTTGHYHLYIDKPITWGSYSDLLLGFLQAGLIEAAWYDNAMRDRRSYVRLPNVKKPTP